MAYQEFHDCIDENSAPSYTRSSRANDTALLKQYITAWDLPSRGIQSYDPFYTAAANGSLDVLRVLLDVHQGNAHSASIEERGFSLLHVACQHAQIEIVNFLLDSDPPLGAVDDRDPEEWTPLMSAAYSTGAFGEPGADRGASARDSVSFPTVIGTTSEGQLVPQAEFTVLSQAIAGSSYGMIKRLLEHGADVQKRLEYYSVGPGFWDDGVDVRDVTALHIGSRSWNVDGIRALLDHCHEGGLIFCRDSMDRLPLHWAAAGFVPGSEPSLLPENTLIQRITSTFELLVPEDDKATTARLINSRDKQGATPLHYAVQAHASCGSEGSNHAYHTIQWLCSRGANAGIVDHRMQTVLHRLAYASLDGEPIDLNLINLLLAHGCPLETRDEDGETPLHILARHLRQAQAANMLIKYGARVDIVNKKGNLPLHEATRAAIRPNQRWDGQRHKFVSLEDRIDAQNEVVEALLDAHGACNVLNQPNGEVKTPRQLREETIRTWKEMEAHNQRK
ncbi:ankyrin repeat-containing domain protein [Aspergillus granulosus]|uniref:Ankyrin repeat-containing domain protein n=1 Tax=Aspergillus granulosus TaxID=176169 RepID=A0ABR4HQW6_9EURO